MAREPVATRSGPEGWFDGSKLLDWSWAVERLQAERNYWVSSTLPGGLPHSRPVWGVWMDDELWLSVGGHQMYRNLRDRPDVVVHTDSAVEVVILHGRARLVEDRSEIERAIVPYNPKYDWHSTPDDLGSWYRVRPAVAYGWYLDAFEGSGTKWTFRD